MKYIIKKAQKHDKEAFVELMELNKYSMYKVARSYLYKEEDIADVMQETILSCYEHISELREIKYFKTWLIKILINKCKNNLKAQKRECLLEAFPDTAEVCKDMQNCEFEELMNTLDEKYRTVLMLYYAEGFKIREIAQILDIEEGTVKTRLVRGRKQFEREYRMEPAVERR